MRLKKLEKILFYMWLMFIFYIIWIFIINMMIDKWVTNSKSEEIVMTQEEEKVYYLPEDTINSTCVQFILKGITKRKVFYSTVLEQSKKLGLDSNIVLSAILGEQIRISCKWVRGSLKDIILNGTPTL